MRIGSKSLFAALAFFCFAAIANDPVVARLVPEPDSAREQNRIAERYVLPITPAVDQGDSDLCWVYATLAMLETDYLQRHPHSRIALSAGALQLDTIADRFVRHIRGERIRLEEGGLAIEALNLIRQNGLVARADFHDVVDASPVYASVRRTLARRPKPPDKLQALRRQLAARLGAKPASTHLDGRVVTPAQLAQAMLGARQWIEFDLARNGAQGWGPSRDPDARGDSRVLYVDLSRMIGLIHGSLARGQAVVAGSKDHSLLIHGGDYDKDGRPIAYMIKDSLPPYAYRVSAEKLHRILNDVTVAF